MTEFDAATLAELRSWEIRDEPRWLALQPAGDVLFVASVRGGRLSRIDLQEGSVAPVPLPRVASTHSSTFDEIALTPRITGDPAVSPNGKTLAIPVLYVDNISPVDDIVISDDDDSEFETPIGEGGGGYDNGLRFASSVVLFPLDPDGVVDQVDGSVVDASGTDIDWSIVRSYPGSVTFAPDSESFVVTLEGAGAVVSLRSAGRPARASADPTAGHGQRHLGAHVQVRA